MPGRTATTTWPTSRLTSASDYTPSDTVLRCIGISERLEIFV